MGIVQQTKGFAGSAKNDLLPSGDARVSQAVDRYAGNLLPPRSLIGVRCRDRPLRASQPDQLCRANRGARRRVDLALVMTLDDLDELEPRGSTGSERGS